LSDEPDRILDPYVDRFHTLSKGRKIPYLDKIKGDGLKKLSREQVMRFGREWGTERLHFAPRSGFDWIGDGR